MGEHIFGRAMNWEGMGGHPCTNTILSADLTQPCQSLPRPAVPSPGNSLCTPLHIWGHQPSSTLQSLEKGRYTGAQHSVAHLRTSAILHAAVSGKRKILAVCCTVEETSHSQGSSLWKETDILPSTCWTFEHTSHPPCCSLWKERENKSHTLWHFWGDQPSSMLQSLKREIWTGEYIICRITTSPSHLILC